MAGLLLWFAISALSKALMSLRVSMGSRWRLVEKEGIVLSKWSLDGLLSTCVLFVATILPGQLTHNCDAVYFGGELLFPPEVGNQGSYRINLAASRQRGAGPVHSD